MSKNYIAIKSLRVTYIQVKRIVSLLASFVLAPLRQKLDIIDVDLANRMLPATH